MLELFNISTTISTFSMVKMSQHGVSLADPTCSPRTIVSAMRRPPSLPPSQLVFFLSDRLFIYLVIYC